ncbi:MAG: hypothetical protein Q4D57_05820 [Clostridia bacterium]|nr:hypothetical protein [Clostridia bacterium]
MNPFKEKPIKIFDSVRNWKELYDYSYNKDEVDPYTKTRIILMNGTEYEANWFSHQFSRNCNDNELRRELALSRYIEKQQQKRIATLKPINETVLETSISYEQLAVDLTAGLAKNEPDVNVKSALDFALLEDFDHLYRYADLLEMEHGILAENLVGKYTEIMPGRPTISHHRHPYDNIKSHIDSVSANPITKLNVAIITAAEQQTMNYYMNIAGFYTSDIGRKLYQEIGLVEEEHVTQYGSLLDPTMTWLENLLCHEYTECYLYYSCFEYETDPKIKRIWEQYFIQEVAHLHKAVELLRKYENKDWEEVIPGGDFPKLLKLEPNVDYVRDILTNTADNTSYRENYIKVSSSDKNSDFFKFQSKINKNISDVPSHTIIETYINKNGDDYRFETKPNPLKELQDRSKDNTSIGRE